MPAMRRLAALIEASRVAALAELALKPLAERKHRASDRGEPSDAQ